MFRFENTVDIDSPIESVFSFVANFENIPRWNYYVMDVRQLTEGPTLALFWIERRSDARAGR